jgi:GMP synthase-like glutamine amidotransferase
VNALILTHHPEEGPGLLEDILKGRGSDMEEVGLWNGNNLPDPTPFHLLILMGGPISVDNDDAYPFLSEEKAMLRQGSWIPPWFPRPLHLFRKRPELDKLEMERYSCCR